MNKIHHRDTCHLHIQFYILSYALRYSLSHFQRKQSIDKDLNQRGLFMLRCRIFFAILIPR